MSSGLREEGRKAIRRCGYLHRPYGAAPTTLDPPLLLASSS